MKPGTTLLSQEMGRKTSPERVKHMRLFVIRNGYQSSYGPDESFDRGSYSEGKRYGENVRYDKVVSGGFYGNDLAYEDLEVRRLESLIGGWPISSDHYRTIDELEKKSFKKWGNLGRSVLGYLIRNPLTTTEAIEYIQRGVQEISEHKELGEKVNRVLTERKGIFQTYESFNDIENECYRVNSFGNYQRGLGELSKVLEEANSQSLKDLGRSLDRLLKNNRFSRASKIAQAESHNLEIVPGITIKGGKHESDYPGHEVRYVTKEGLAITFHEIADEKLYRGGKFNAYQPIWNAIAKSLTTQGFESLEAIAFDGAVLAFMNGLSGLADVYKNNGIAYTFPTINNSEGELFFQGAVHPFLLEKDPTPNDIDLNSKSSLDIVAGANNGGKTTYLKTTGLLTLLSQIGAPIPAKVARISPRANMYTHFPKTESVISGNGRFVDELKRLRHIFEKADKSSLVLLDEPCSGTSDEDAIDVSMDTVEGLQEIGCPTVYSTHLHEIQKRIDSNEEYSNCKNLYVETKGTIQKPKFTHKIKRGIAGKSYGKVHAQKILPIKEILKARRIGVK